MRDVGRRDPRSDPFYMAGLTSPSSSEGGSSPLYSGQFSPTSPSYTPSTCPPTQPMLTLLPGESFPAAELGADGLLDGSEWLAACLPILSRRLGQPCSVVRQARPATTSLHLWARHALCDFQETVDGEVDSSNSDSDAHSLWLSGPASPTSPPYTPSPRRSSPSRQSGACSIVARSLEPFRGLELPRTLTLKPGESFPAIALGSQPALDGSDWLEMCLHTLTAALGEPCSVVIEARAHVPPVHTL